jgi:hypothetical protein
MPALLTISTLFLHPSKTTSLLNNINYFFTFAKYPPANQNKQI